MQYNDFNLIDAAGPAAGRTNAPRISQARGLGVTINKIKNKNKKINSSFGNAGKGTGI